MIVFGYTDDKIVERIDLPIETVVAMEIDPWRLDLFDANPVTLPRRDKPSLQFRRLREVSFAYKLAGPIWIVGIHDGEAATCFKATISKGRPGLHDLKVITTPADLPSHLAPAIERSDKWTTDPFSGHLWRYLDCCEQSKAYDLALAAYHSSGVQLKGNELYLDDAFELNRVTDKGSFSGFKFAGEMLTERSMPVAERTEVSWLFETLNQFGPAVIGEAARNQLQGKKIDVVEFLVEYGAGRPATNHLESVLKIKTEACPEWAPWHPIAFHHGNTRYMGTEIGAPRPAGNAGAAVVQLFDFCGEYTADRLYSTRSGEVRYSRIALLDAAHTRARRLNKFGSASTGINYRRARLWDLGFSLLPDDILGPATPDPLDLDFNRTGLSESEFLKLVQERFDIPEASEILELVKERLDQSKSKTP